MLPIRIAADAFAPNVPSSDLTVSPGHGIVVSVVDEVLMPAATTLGDMPVYSIRTTVTPLLPVIA